MASKRAVILRDDNTSKQIYPRVLATEIFKEPISDDADATEQFVPQEKMTASDGITITGNNISQNLSINGNRRFEWNEDSETYDIQLDDANRTFDQNPTYEHYSNVVSSGGVYDMLPKIVKYSIRLMDDGVDQYNDEQDFYDMINQVFLNAQGNADFAINKILKIYVNGSMEDPDNPNRSICYYGDNTNLHFEYSQEDNGNADAIFKIDNITEWSPVSSVSPSQINVRSLYEICNDFSHQERGNFDFFVEVLSVPLVVSQNN